ncbi:hypothetical protein BJ508DRAFT_412699 [Ascobolus immersus RN42]|uniref:F-box domain-containing protein n=1 Tax=Ascobolus immersus RN42 TaxID=1160509 RepID=A0A3N4IFA2_ASCIM|nr:hypothetical protein BJ508DRAFT_412699 [Ascobolus immersus RN42]
MTSGAGPITSPSKADSQRAKNKYPSFQVPTETRFEIYRLCTAFTLLQLSQTCAFFREELSSCLSIVSATYGFNDQETCRSLPQTCSSSCQR